MKKLIKSLLRKKLNHSQIIKLRSIQFDPWQVFYRDKRACNICGFEGRFWSWPGPSARGEICPRCMGLSRHRMMKLFFASRKFSPCRVLHVAPEKAVRLLLKQRGFDRITSIDLNPQEPGIEKQDLAQLTYEDNSFGLVICSHVLEHVLDDRRALRELHRVLKPGGQAILLVPIIESWDETYENPEIKTEAERSRHFGQKDHVRFYGRDFRDRLRDAHFALSEFRATPRECISEYTNFGETIFLAEKIPQLEVK